MKNLIKLAVCLCAFLYSSIQVNATPLQPIELFAVNSEISLMRISPNGEMVAFLRTENGQPSVLVKELGGKVISGASLSETKPSNIRWAGDNFVLITVSVTHSDLRLTTGQQRQEYFRTYSLNVKTKKLVQLLRNNSANLSSYSFNLGGITAIDHDAGFAIVPAFNQGFELDLYKVNLKTGNGLVYANAIRHVNDWVLDSDNHPIIRVYHNQRTDDFEIQKRNGKSWPAIFQKNTAIAPVSAIGLSVDQKSLVVQSVSETVPYVALYKMDLQTGEMGAPFFQVDGRDLEGFLVDPYTNLVIGASWTEDQDQYHWFDPQFQTIYLDLKNALPDHAVRIISWSKDRKKILISFAKMGEPSKFAVYSTDTFSLKVVASSRPNLANVGLGTVSSFIYKARDGLEIPSYLTLPYGKGNKNLPLVVLPHGGPEARDSANFDWLSQLIASRGYAVLQPNFRGSSGYGRAFTRAGWGEWGKAMQHDVTDGVQKLIANGTVDPDRICIVGASYGGYAALAGGAFTPDLYQCVVSIAGVSDLKEMYDWSKVRFGRDNWVVKYWNRSMTGDQTRNQAMRAVSPVHFAKNFQAPVLLIHGKDDTVVPIVQSKKMNNALKRANVEVRFVEQKTGDHWMSSEETRMQTAREMITFLDQHLK